MPAESLWIVVSITVAFGALGLALAFAEMTANAKAITWDEEQRRKKP